jgi:ribA/ribD-fused uncharacterized protein
MSKKIDVFTGRYRPFSNFGGTLPITSEHLFQAMKGTTWEEQLYVLAAPTPGEAKKRGRRIKCRPDWENVKVQIMWCVIQAKFASGTEFAQLLLDTGDSDLIEGNWHGDSFWGFDFKAEVGQNMLGNLLMEWREQLQEMEEENEPRQA